MSDLSNYGELVDYIGDLLDRDDLETRVPTFVRLAEARLNRLLDDPEMEVTTVTVASDDYTALPADFGSMVSISTGDGQLSAVSAAQFAAFDHSITGTPRSYVIVDNGIGFAPANSTAEITMVYRRRIPSLSVLNPSNWLLSLAPDVYLYGTLVQAEAFLAEDERVAGWKDMFDEAIGELRSDAIKRKWGAGPIAPRVRRP